jgi:hypothetical protein
MATPTLANPRNAHQLLAEATRPLTALSYPKSQLYFRVFPTGQAEYYWCIVASATNQTISRHKSLSFAITKCKRLNDLSREGARHDIN